MFSDANSVLSQFVDIDSMVSEMEKSKEKKFWRPSLPKTVVRILPAIKANSEKIPYMGHRVHWVSGKPYECLNQTLVDKDGNLHQPEPCPLCKMAKELYNTKTDAAIDLAKQISAKTRYVARVVVRDDKELGNTPVFYEMPFGIYSKLESAILSGEWGSVVGPTASSGGHDFNICKSGEGKYTNYDNSNFKPLATDLCDTQEEMIQILTAAKNMPYNSLISFQDAKTLENAAMEIPEVAKFFSPKTETRAVAHEIKKEEVDDFIDPIPPVADDTPLQNDDIDALLKSLI